MTSERHKFLHLMTSSQPKQTSLTSTGVMTICWQPFSFHSLLFNPFFFLCIKLCVWWARFVFHLIASPFSSIAYTSVLIGPIFPTRLSDSGNYQKKKKTGKKSGKGHFCKSTKNIYINMVEFFFFFFFLDINSQRGSAHKRAAHSVSVCLCVRTTLEKGKSPRQPLITPIWLLLPLVSFSGNDSRHKYFISLSSGILFWDLS